MWDLCNAQSWVTLSQNLSSGLWEDGSVNAGLSTHKPNQGVFACYVVCMSVYLHMSTDMHVCECMCKTIVDIWLLPQLFSTSLTKAGSCVELEGSLPGQLVQCL